MKLNLGGALNKVVTRHVEKRGEDFIKNSEHYHPPRTSLPDSTALNQQSTIPPKVGIIRKIVHTRTELNIYPNGQMYVGKTQSWIEGAVYTPKKKKKGTVKVTKTKMNKEEVYWNENNNNSLCYDFHS